MKTNVHKTEVTTGFTTHEGGLSVKESPLKELRRAVSACLLFENTFYEKGSDLAKRISDLCDKVDLHNICQLALVARTDLRLRHVPLYLMVQALRKDRGTSARNEVGETIAAVIQRADELAEILAIYWAQGRRPVPRQLRAGLAKAFRKFSEYELAKYDRDGAVKLRDALFLSHAKPLDSGQADLWKRLAEGKLETPDTWEVALSGGADKKEVFSRLLLEGKLGYLALLRNLRNMSEAGVMQSLVEIALISGAAKSRTLPFQFLAAYRAAPMYGNAVGEAMVQSVEHHPRLEGKTVVLVDVSGSMDSELSEKGTLVRRDAAIALAILLREIGNTRVFVFGTQCREVSALRGLALDAHIRLAQQEVGGSTRLGAALEYAHANAPDVDRMVVITDEQSEDRILLPAIAHKVRRYMINVGTYEPALPILGGGFKRVSGFSDRVVDWILEEERLDNE